MTQELIKALNKISDDLVIDIAKDPFLSSILAGTASRDDFAIFLTQSYWYVAETSPALARAAEVLRRGGRDPDLVAFFEKKWTEEFGHERWLLNDRAIVDEDLDPAKLPAPSCAVVAYARFHLAMMETGSPIAYLGNAFVLESLAVRLAGVASARLIERAGVPVEGVSFLRGHADADPHHVAELVEVLSHIDDPTQIELITLSAQVTRTLYPRFFCAP